MRGRNRFEDRVYRNEPVFSLLPPSASLPPIARGVEAIVFSLPRVAQADGAEGEVGGVGKNERVM